MTVPTLIMIGESDDWTPADACRKLVEGQSDWGISRKKSEGASILLNVYPGAITATTLRLCGRRSNISDITLHSTSQPLIIRPTRFASFFFQKLETAHKGAHPIGHERSPPARLLTPRELTGSLRHRFPSALCQVRT